ncbi:MAG: peptidylprolyl isomerase [Nostocaceae cyanobacterium]|nr:peptidylprolyl isomerase [Nostocaceae cyanobacterium]
MPKIMNVSSQDIIHRLKLSCQIPGLMEAIATHKIITEAATALGITVSDNELQQEGDNLRVAYKLVKAKDTWSWLEKHHLSISDFEELVQTNVLSKKIAHHLFNQQVEKFFYAHQIEYIGAVTYEVIFNDRDLALELFYALQEGEISFPEITQQYIQNPELRRAFGYQGIRHRRDFRPEIAAAVFAAKPPQILKPITTPKGVHLIWVEEIIQPQLDEKLCFQIQQDLFSGWLKQQIMELEIMIQPGSNPDVTASTEILQPA